MNNQISRELAELYEKMTDPEKRKEEERKEKRKKAIKDMVEDYSL